jgi:hypothetical protein
LPQRSKPPSRSRNRSNPGSSRPATKSSGGRLSLSSWAHDQSCEGPA